MVRPLFLGSVDVQLQPITIGIVQIQRLTDPVIGGAVEGDACCLKAMQGIGEVDAMPVPKPAP